MEHYYLAPSAHFQDQPRMVVNSVPFACFCIRRQTVNHLSVSGVADVEGNQNEASSVFPLHSESETMPVPVHRLVFVFPHPHAEISPKCPDQKREREREIILLSKLF